MKKKMKRLIIYLAIQLSALIHPLIFKRCRYTVLEDVFWNLSLKEIVNAIKEPYHFRMLLRRQLSNDYTPPLRYKDMPYWHLLDKVCNALYTENAEEVINDIFNNVSLSDLIADLHDDQYCREIMKMVYENSNLSVDTRGFASFFLSGAGKK